jgi:hypothetical protein
LRLGSQEFADEIYGDLSEQAIEAAEWWSDASVDISLTPHAQHDQFFDVTVRWEYTTVPGWSSRSFACVGDRREYADIAKSRGQTSAWYMKPNDIFDPADRKAFELLAFSVNGTPCSIKRSSRKHYQAYSVHLPDEVLETNEPVVIAYTLRTVTRRSGHSLFFEIEQPTRGVSVNLDYSDAGISSISALDLVPSVRPTRIEHSPEGVPTSSVRVEIDGWTFPRSGVAFVWTLEDERIEAG